MKTKKNLMKLFLKKDTVANLNFLNMRMIKAGEPPTTSGYITCDEPYSTDEMACTSICPQTIFDTCNAECVSTIISCDC